MNNKKIQSVQPAISNQGISLVEMMVAVAILGIIAMGVFQLQIQSMELFRSSTAKLNASQALQIMQRNIDRYVQQRIVVRNPSTGSIANPGITRDTSNARMKIYSIRNWDAAGDSEQTHIIRTYCDQLPDLYQGNGRILAIINRINDFRLCNLACANGERPSVLITDASGQRKKYPPSNRNITQDGLAAAACIDLGTGGEINVMYHYYYIANNKRPASITKSSRFGEDFSSGRVALKPSR